MAEKATNASVGIPDVAPDQQVPDAYQHIDANPASFGALTAQGVQHLGQGAEKVGEGLFDIAQFQGKVNVDDQVNSWITRKDAVMRGEPGKFTVGPNGEQIPDRGYLGLEGRTALDQRKDTLAALEDARVKGLKNLKSPQEQLLYNEQTRRMYSIASDEISKHADGQYKTWAGGVNNAGAGHALNGFLSNLDNPEQMAHHASDYINFRVQDAQLKYGDDPNIKAQVVQDAKRELLSSQLEFIAVKDPARAMSVLDKNRDLAGPRYDELANKFRTRAEHQRGSDAATDAVVKASSRFPYANPTLPIYQQASTAVQGGLSARGLARTVQLESGGNPKSGLGTAHVGLAGFGDAAWGEVGQGDRTDPDAAVYATARYSAKNAPILRYALNRMPTDAELYLAHQQGGAGASRLLTNPTARAGSLVGDAAIRQNGGNPDLPASAFTSMWINKFNSPVGEHGSGTFLRMQADQASPAAAPIAAPRENFEAAKADLKLDPQEQALYEKHLVNLTGPGGVDNDDGSRSSLFAVTAGIGDRTYVIPTVWDGKVLPPADAIERAKKEGLGSFPSYATQAEAKARYDKMHDYMDKDTGTFLRARAQSGGGNEGPGTPGGPVVSVKSDAYSQILDRTDLNHQEKQFAISTINQTLTAQSIAENEDAKAKKAANDKAANTYVEKLLTGKDTAGLVQQIATDPNLDHSTRWSLGQAALAKTGNDVDLAANNYGPGFWTMYKAVTAPIGDPGRISDPAYLLSRAGPGGDLTLAGVQKLRTTMQESMKSVNDNSVHTAKVGLLNYAKSKLSFEADTGPIKIRDPKGEALFNANFIPKFEAAFDQWVKDGKDPWQFLTQENVDKLMKGMRSKAQMDQDRLVATGEAGGLTEDKNALPPVAPEGINPAGWKSVIEKPPLMSNGRNATYEQWGQALKVLASSPTPELMAQFDQWFGAGGYKATEVLGALGIKKPAEASKPVEAPAATETVPGVTFSSPPSPPQHRLLDRDAPGGGPASVLGDLIRSVTPQGVQDYVASKGR